MSSAAPTTPFSAPESTHKSIVGGKGANLGLLTQAGFQVPEGFTCTTSAYDQFIKQGTLNADIFAIVGKINYDDADDLESKTSQVRELILNTTIPTKLGNAIVAEYAKLGHEVYVAVRSSGTAEDLAEASFAGLHDTLLDIRGVDALLTALRECWASLWSSRAVSYRNRNGFAHADVSLAVVIQRMVASEFAGVLFTANPMTSSTDECVVNASWGLGEAVVSGVVTPDTYYVKSSEVRVRCKNLGEKEVTISRNPAVKSGTVEKHTTDADRERFTMTDEQAIELARLGLRVQAHYGGFPQDIEWGYEAGQFYLLQSRPITGIEFSWDSDCEDYQIYKDRDDVVWTRTQADESWSGAISPLFYSCRANSWDAGHQSNAVYWGFDELKGHRYWRYHKGVAYYNCEIEKALLERTMPPQIRGSFLMHIPPVWRENVMAGKNFTWFGYLKMIARIEAIRPQLYNGFKVIDVKWRGIFSNEGKGLSREKLKELSDYELKRYLEYFVHMETEWNSDTWTFWFIYCRDMFSWLNWIVYAWYFDSKDDEVDPSVFQSLMTGSTNRTETIKANVMLFDMCRVIRYSPSLTKTFHDNPGVDFFEACKESEDGKKLLDVYKTFIELYGQRGMPDRDMSFKRRVEDPEIDYRALASMLSGSDEHPEVKEKECDKIREEATAKVLAKIQSGLLGTFKAEIFKIVHDWCLRFACTRDDERNYLDNLTLTWRFGFLELGRRLTERGVFKEADDVWWLCRTELWPIFGGAPLTPLHHAKMAARKKNFNTVLARESELPLYLVNGAPADLEDHANDELGIMRGSGTARGSVTAKANIVRQLQDIGKVKPGDILVVNATDPGWTPVFSIIGGIVLETGGVLAHGSCLAREYGLPGVQLISAMSRIPDGATITINGERGTVQIHEEEVAVPNGIHH